MKLRLPDLMALLGADTAHKGYIRRLAVEGAPLACVVRPRERHEVTQTRCEQLHGVPLLPLPLSLPTLLPRRAILLLENAGHDATASASPLLLRPVMIAPTTA